MMHGQKNIKLGYITVYFLCIHHSSSAGLERGTPFNKITQFWKQYITYAFYILHL